MNKKHVRRNVVLYKLFVIFNEPLFWGPVVIASIQELGHMSLADIFFMESAVMVLCVLLNIPSGALADLIGQKTTIIIGRIFLLGSAIGFTTQYDPFTAWLANIMWAIGYSFQSGADVSFFYNFLKDNGLEKKFKKIEGCAGGSLLKNLDILLREETGLPVFLSEDPLSAVALGAGLALENLDLLKGVTLE